MGRRPLKLPVRSLPDGMRTSVSSCGRSTGSVRSRIASSSWKIAVFAPIPSASDAIAASAKVLSRLSTRAA